MGFCTLSQDHHDDQTECTRVDCKAMHDLQYSRPNWVAYSPLPQSDRLAATELQEAAAAGIPISPSLSGPHAEEQMTQMEVFFKQFKYPEHKCFIL